MGENPNEKGVEGEPPGDGDKGGEFPDDFGEEKPNETEIIVPPQEDRDTPTVKVTESPEDKEPLVIATKPALQETVATKPAVQETVATKPVVQETGATKLVVQETVAAKPAVEEVIDLESITLELDNLQRAAQETLVELTISQTSRDLDTLEKVAQLAELGSSEANEELDALDQVVQQLMAEAARLSPLPSEPTRLFPLPSEPTRLSPLPSEPTRLSPLPSQPTRLSSQPKFFYHAASATVTTENEEVSFRLMLSNPE